MSIFQQQKIPGVACENGKKCTKMDINFFLFSRDEVQKYFKMHQNGCKCQKNFHGWRLKKYLKMHHNGYPFVKNFPGVTCQNTSKCIKMDVNFKKKSGSGLWKWLKMHQNGYPFFKNFPGMKSENTSKCTKMDVNVKRNSRADVWKNTSKCTKMDIRFSKISRELLVKIPQSTWKWMSI